VVSEFGGALSAMNDKNRRAFLEKLRALKTQENWSDADYAVRAKPYVRDEKILAFDAKGRELLQKVQALGGGESLTEEKRCAMLGDLKKLLAAVVGNTREKWDYMFAKLSGALRPAAAAGLEATVASRPQPAARSPEPAPSPASTPAKPAASGSPEGRTAQ
jgi:hypothetical protein